MHVFLLPVILFLIITGFGIVRLVIFVRKFRVSVRPGEEGAALHVETPAGNLDLEPRQQLDSRFAGFVFYPGAEPQIAGSPEYVAVGRDAAEETRFITATYWTPDLSGKVLEFYRARLPRWIQEREWLGEGEHAWNLTDPSEPGRSIRIRAEASRKSGGTTIEYTIHLGA